MFTFDKFALTHSVPLDPLGHFALIKWQEQEQKVPEGAPHFWLKRIVPPLEFGSMHAILFQMALIPLTVSRFSIAALSESTLNRFVPLNRAVRIHIHLGYTMVSIVFLATIFFFIFFGILCADGEQAFCDKFTDEIMITRLCHHGDSSRHWGDVLFSTLYPLRALLCNPPHCFHHVRYCCRTYV